MLTPVGTLHYGLHREAPPERGTLNVGHRVFERVVILLFEVYYSKEPKSVTAFGLFTFFRADLIQSEAS